jgi:hypothetical protein
LVCELNQAALADDKMVAVIGLTILFMAGTSRRGTETCARKWGRKFLQNARIM